MRCFLLIAALSFAASAQAKELTPEVRARLFAPTADVRLSDKVVRIPMRGSDHAGNDKCPYFQVYVNGRGPFVFLYDTGAAYTLISTKVVEAAKATVVFDRGGERDVVQLDRISLGGLTLRNVWAIHDDNFGVDGIIGFPTLGMANVLFDFSDREILVSHGTIPMARSFSLPYESALNVPTVPVRIGARTIPVLIDTGDDAYGLELKSSELGDAATLHSPEPAATVMNGAIEQTTFVTTLSDPVVLGPVWAERAGIAINDSLPVGDFGYDALRQFRFQLDPKRHTVTFQPLFKGSKFNLAATSPKTKPGF